MNKILTCKVCQKDFISNSPTHAYCSLDCRQFAIKVHDGYYDRKHRQRVKFLKDSCITCKADLLGKEKWNLYCKKCKKLSTKRALVKK